MYKSKDDNHLIKILLLGDARVGKSSMLLRFTEDIFNPGLSTTNGMDFKTKTIDCAGQQIKAQVWNWNFGGQGRFPNVNPKQYSGAHGIMLIYDIGDRRSFDSIRYWRDQIMQYAKAGVKYILVGHHASGGGDREVDAARGQALAEEYGISFYEVSAKDNVNIYEAFMDLSLQIMQERNNTELSAEEVKRVDPYKKLLDSALMKQADAIKLLKMLDYAKLAESRQLKGFRDEKSGEVSLRALKPYKNKIVDAILLLPETEQKVYIVKALQNGQALFTIINYDSSWFSLFKSPQSRLKNALSSIEAAEKLREDAHALQHELVGMIISAEQAILYFENQLAPLEGVR